MTDAAGDFSQWQEVQKISTTTLWIFVFSHTLFDSVCAVTKRNKKNVFDIAIVSVYERTTTAYYNDMFYITASSGSLTMTEQSSTSGCGASIYRLPLFAVVL